MLPNRLCARIRFDVFMTVDVWVMSPFTLHGRRLQHVSNITWRARPINMRVCLLLACSVCWLFDVEDECSTLLRSVGELLPDCTAPQPRRQYCAVHVLDISTCNALIGFGRVLKCEETDLRCSRWRIACDPVQCGTKLCCARLHGVKFYKTVIFIACILLCITIHSIIAPQSTQQIRNK
jgi:hypothetical protein